MHNNCNINYALPCKIALAMYVANHKVYDTIVSLHVLHYSMAFICRYTVLHMHVFNLDRIIMEYIYYSLNSKTIQKVAIYKKG